MRHFSLILLVLLSSVFVANAQSSQSEKGYFLFEEEKFSLPIKDMINAYEGFPATPFMANNLKGNELYIGDFKGKPLVLLFWKSSDSFCEANIPAINQLSQHFQDKMEIVSFADEDRPTMKKYAKSKPVDFHIIPNSKIFGEAAYAIDLGYPRMFVIDGSGIIKKVIPQQAFEQSPDVFNMLKSVILEVM